MVISGIPSFVEANTWYPVVPNNTSEQLTEGRARLIVCDKGDTYRFIISTGKHSKFMVVKDDG